MKNLYNRNTLILLFVIAAVSINLRLGITSIGPLMDTLKESLNLSSTQASLLTTVPVLCMGIFALLATVLNKMLGSKITLLLMLSILLISTLIRGFYTGFIILLISAFFVGLAIAVLAPTLSSVIKKYFPGHAAVAIGISSFFMSAGSATTAALTGAFYTSMDSYPFALAIWSVFSLLAIIVVLFIYKPGAQNNMPSQAVPEVKYNFPSPWVQKMPWLFMLFYALQVVLGLISSKIPELEDKEEIKGRIEEAAKYISKDRLCLSPQCGFASTEEGNNLTEEEQWAKLQLVKEIAEEVWG